MDSHWLEQCREGDSLAIETSGRSTLSHNPLMLIIPSLSILLISMSFLLLGDFLNGITRQEQE